VCEFSTSSIYLFIINNYNSLIIQKEKWIVTKKIEGDLLINKFADLTFFTLDLDSS